MIIGAHAIIYSKSPEADRAFVRDVLEFPNIDVGGGWLIFGLPPSELAVHPSDENGVHEFYLMCADVEAFVAKMRKHRVACDAIQNQGWGLLTAIKLPGGGKLGVYQPRHARPKSMPAPKVSKKSARRAGKSSPKRAAGKKKTSRKR
jgi:hypothetical protein